MMIESEKYWSTIRKNEDIYINGHRKWQENQGNGVNDKDKNGHKFYNNLHISENGCSLYHK